MKQKELNMSTTEPNAPAPDELQGWKVTLSFGGSVLVTPPGGEPKSWGITEHYRSAWCVNHRKEWEGKEIPVALFAAIADLLADPAGSDDADGTHDPRHFSFEQDSHSTPKAYNIKSSLRDGQVVARVSEGKITLGGGMCWMALTKNDLRRFVETAQQARPIDLSSPTGFMEGPQQPLSWDKQDRHREILIDLERRKKTCEWELRRAKGEHELFEEMLLNMRAAFAMSDRINSFYLLNGADPFAPVSYVERFAYPLNRAIIETRNAGDEVKKRFERASQELAELQATIDFFLKNGALPGEPGTQESEDDE